jgi:hypothetical protein
MLFQIHKEEIDHLKIKEAFGLKYIPYAISPPQEISDLELLLCHSQCLRFSNKAINIMEIGVHRNMERSFTNILTGLKNSKSKYLGVDIEDKSFLDNEKKNIYTLKCSSGEFETVCEFLNSKGMKNLDLLFIDGDHSFPAVSLDWRYASLLNQGGIVLLHDIHVCIGPYLLLELIDPDIFDIHILTKTKENVNGLAMITRK